MPKRSKNTSPKKVKEARVGLATTFVSDVALLRKEIAEGKTFSLSQLKQRVRTKFS